MPAVHVSKCYDFRVATQLVRLVGQTFSQAVQLRLFPMWDEPIGRLVFRLAIRTGVEEAAIA